MKWTYPHIACGDSRKRIDVTRGLLDPLPGDLGGPANRCRKRPLELIARESNDVSLLISACPIRIRAALNLETDDLIGTDAADEILRGLGDCVVGHQREGKSYCKRNETASSHPSPPLWSKRAQVR